MLGRFVGITESVGHALTFKILTDEMEVISRSLVRKATKGGIFDNQKAKAKAKNKPNAKIQVGEKIAEVVVEMVEEGEDATVPDEDAEDLFPTPPPESSDSQCNEEREEDDDELPTLTIPTPKSAGNPKRSTTIELRAAALNYVQQPRSS